MDEIIWLFARLFIYFPRCIIAVVHPCRSELQRKLKQNAKTTIVSSETLTKRRCSERWKAVVGTKQ